MSGRRSRLVIMPSLAAALTIIFAVRAWLRRAPIQATLPYELTAGLTDFKDTAVFPNLGRFAGVNVYDIPWYRSEYPEIQEFDAYGPHWLTMTAPFATMEWKLSTGVWLGLAALWVLFCAMLLTQTVVGQRRTVTQQRPGSHWARALTDDTPRKAALTLGSVFVILFWSWRPTTIAFGLGNASLYTALAVALLLLGTQQRLGIILVMVAWIKPQFGAPVTLLLLASPQRRAQAILGTLLAAAISLPATYQLAQSAGGFLPLSRSVIEGATTVAKEHAESAPGRIDVVGLFERTGHQPGNTASIGVAIVVLALAAFVYRRFSEYHTGLSALACAFLINLALPHMVYDTILIIPPLAISALTIHLFPSRGLRIGWGVLACLFSICCMLPWTRLGLAPAGSAEPLQWTNWILGTLLMLCSLAVLARSRRTSPGVSPIFRSVV